MLHVHFTYYIEPAIYSYIPVQRRTNIFQGVDAEVTIWQSHSPKSP